MPDEKGIFWVFSDIVDFTYVNEVPMRLLDMVDITDHKNSKPIYAKVVRKTLSCINIDFKRNPSSETFDGFTDIACILHFRKA